VTTFAGDFATQAARQASAIEPVLEITLNSATWRGGVALNLSGAVASARGKSYAPLVADAGWSDIRRYFDVLGSNLARQETTVTICDPDRELQTALEAGQQRGSAAAIYWVIPGNATDYALRFVGVLESWGYAPGETTLTLRTSDAALRTYVPTHQLTASEWTGIPTSSIGKYVPLVYGEHNSSGLSGTGHIPCLPVYENGGVWWYTPCLGQAKEIIAVYVNGVLQTPGLGNDYIVNYSFTRAGKAYTIVQFIAAQASDAVVTCDMIGYETSGNTGAGTTAPTGSAILNQVEQWRHLILNHAEAKYQSGPWATGAGDIIDAQSWAECARWAEQRSLEGSGYIGGGAESRLLLDVLNEQIEGSPFRAYWTPLGKLALRVIDLAWPGYRQSTDPPVLGTEAELGSSFEYTLDTTDLTDSISAAYLFDVVQGAYMAGLAVIDPDMGEGVSSNINMPWSIARAT
jgi:hypothetical protein